MKNVGARRGGGDVGHKALRPERRKGRPGTNPDGLWRNARSGYWQLFSVNDPTWVLQLKLPLLFRYSSVYQNVQSLSGSTLSEL